MAYKAGESVTLEFTVTDGTGALADADSTPSATEVIDGTDQGTSVTVTNKATGIYKAAWTISGSKDSQLDLRVEVTMGGTDAGETFRLGKLDSARLDDLEELIGNLTSGTSAINTSAESEPDGFHISIGESEANDEDSTRALDAETHDLEDTGDTTDCYYIFDVGGNGTAVAVTWWGYVQGKHDTYSVYAHDWGADAWEQIGTVDGINDTTVESHTFTLSNAHTGTGANLGEVRLRFYSEDGSLLATDRIMCSYAIVTKSVGYARGAIWVNTNASNTNTESYVDGVADNPVSTWAAALTISDDLGIENFEIANGSSIVLSGNSDNYTLMGADWALDLNDKSVTDMYVTGATVEGIGTVTGGTLHCYHCIIGTATLGKAHLLRCGFTDTITLSDAAMYIFEHCYAADTGGEPPVIDMGAGVANTTVGLRMYSGGIKVMNLGQSGTDKVTVQGNGHVTIDSTCSGGTLGVSGNMLIADNVDGGFSGTLVEGARIDVGQINAEADSALSDYDPPTRTEATSDKDEIIAEVGDLEEFAKADVYLDTDTTPWSIVWAENGTGDAGAPAVLLRKYLYDSDDNAITDLTTRLAQQLRDTL